MKINDPYRHNIQRYKTKLLKLTQVLNRLSTLRLLAFVFSLIIIAFLANERLLVLLLITVPLCMLGFGLLIKRYNQVAYLKRHTTFLKKLNEDEVLKLENKLSGFLTGQTFINRDHPYVGDLDIFGTHSLFQLLNRTTTESGNVCLAEWLSALCPSRVSRRGLYVRTQASCARDPARTLLQFVMAPSEFAKFEYSQ